MEKAIGGYFELELPRHEEYHKDALRLNSGKNCLEYILRCRKYSKVYLPYYTCDVLLKPFEKLGIAYQFYHINLQFEISEIIDLRKNEALLYTNYYGLKQRYAEQLSKKYGRNLIMDNTQAFFAKPIEGIDTFYTCRKFFGVSDGAYLYTDAKPIDGLQRSVSFNRIAQLIKRIDLSPEAGFEDFHQADEKLAEDEIMLMSRFTDYVMKSIDYQKIALKRRANFMQLHDHLHMSNLLYLPLESDTVPMVYPYLIDGEELRQHLIQNRIFVAKYWPNVMKLTADSSIESYLTRCMVPLPIDQRYDENQMFNITNIIRDYYDTKRKESYITANRG